MAATDFSPSPAVSRSLTATENSRAFVDTLQLVEPKQKTVVPNHIVDSKIYSKIARNDCFQVEPAVVHFGGMEIGKVQKQSLKLVNISTDVQRLHIIPPQSKYFNIKYTKQNRFVPGLTLDCVIEFTPDEWRYYYDCVRIHCKSEENLFVPIHAYPIISTDDFPTSINFPAVPVGQRATRIIPLRCFAPIDFDFQINILQPHTAFTVFPKTGVVPASGEIDVAVHFCPTEFSTARMKLQLLVSQFNAEPLICIVTGSSTPGLAKTISESKNEDCSDILDPRCITPVERARAKRKTRKGESSASPSTKSKKEEERNGIRFPADLDTPYAVAQVLNQQPGKLRTKDIREAAAAKKKVQKKMTRQMKEAMFEVALREDSHEERQNQLRWQVKLGEDPMSSEAKQKLLDERERAWDEYKVARGDPVEEKECSRVCTECSFRRTVRDASVVGRDDVTFDPYHNDVWAARLAAIGRFQQAARKVIVRRRADRKLRLLREAMIEWKKTGTGNTGQKMESQTNDINGDRKGAIKLDANRITSVTFPRYVDPNVKDDMAVDALGVVSVKPTEVVTKKKTPFFELKVPQYYSLLGYKRHDAHEASLNYVPVKPTRSLRTGAEDEIVSVPEAALAKFAPAAQTAAAHSDLRVEDVTGATPPPDREPGTASQSETLKPPEGMLQPMKYPPMHIFNPTPGLQVFQAPLPYSEVDNDFHLCPLPRYVSHDPANPHSATQKKYLDREDTIKGVMTWKKFPCQGLASLVNTPTLTSVWVPRWSDQFSEDLLPSEVPTLREALSEEERARVDGACREENGAQLTPDVVNAMFPSVDEQPPREDSAKKDAQSSRQSPGNDPASSSTPVTREMKERELESEVRRKYNRLGERIQQRIHSMNSQKTDPK